MFKKSITRSYWRYINERDRTQFKTLVAFLDKLICRLSFGCLRVPPLAPQAMTPNLLFKKNLKYE